MVETACNTPKEIAFTLVSSIKPSRVSKNYGLEQTGTLRKGKTSAHISDAEIKTLSVHSLADFGSILSSLNHNNCLIYGIVPDGQQRMWSTKRWVEDGCPSDVVPRKADVFKWPSGSGILMLDYDPPKDGSRGLERRELLEAIDRALGGQLCTVDHLWWPSTSSCLWHGDTELAGIKGQRVYLPVAKAQDIPRAGAALVERLWALGYGRIEVSASGQLLERTIVDSSVWQTNRIDFAAGAVCADGVEQRRGAPELIEGILGTDWYLDTESVIPDLSDDEKIAAEQAKTIAKREARPAAERAKESWIAARADEIIERAGIDPDNQEVREAALSIARRAVEQRELAGDWILKTEGGQELTVLDVLNAPEKYHGLKTYDPIEPDYDGGRLVGKLYLIGGYPSLYSFAHGGVTYRLRRAPARVRMVKGMTHDMTLDTIAVMRNSRDFYNFDKALVSPTPDGKLTLHTVDGLFHALGGITQFFYEKVDPKTQLVETVVCDPPLAVVKSVLARETRRDLPALTAVITAPTLRPDGSVISTSGYDAATGLFLIPRGDIPYINVAPGLDEARRALAFLWEPFKDFPFVDGVARAVHLAALFSAIVRPVLPTCPAFGYDAPARGSGKTLLARCVCILATGEEPPIYAPTTDDDEIRKRVISILVGGRGAFVWDNVIGQFDSAVIGAFLTGPTFSDRILGISKEVVLPNRSLMTLTGNNLHPTGDMARRVLIARIDPISDAPFLRCFAMDPAKYCLANRQAMLAAALTLLRYHFGVCGAERRGQGNTASFEEWDRMVRQPVLRVHSDVAPGYFGDVAEIFHASLANDPSHDATVQLLRAIAELVGTGNYATAATLNEKARAGYGGFGPAETAGERFWEALNELVPGKHGNWTVKALGRVLDNRNGTVADGLRLDSRPGKDRKQYRVDAI